MKCLPKKYDVENAEKDSGLLNGTSEGEPLQLALEPPQQLSTH
ncbi:MAG: hypothetical protein QW290_08065 [Sulfolobales archaeon]